LQFAVRLRVAVRERGIRAPIEWRAPGRLPGLSAAEPDAHRQRLQYPPGADLFQRETEQADRVPALVPEEQQQLRPPQCLPQLPLRRTSATPIRPLPSSVYLRMGQALELGVPRPRTIAVRDELRAEPPDRADGMGELVQESPGIRRRDLRRRTQ